MSGNSRGAKILAGVANRSYARQVCGGVCGAGSASLSRLDLAYTESSRLLLHVTAGLLSVATMWHDWGVPRSPMPRFLLANDEPRLAAVNMIRTFRNADVPALADVWIRHWSTMAPPPQVTMAMMEQALLARTFFDASLLIVSEAENGISGFCHLCDNDSNFVLCSLCVIPEAQDQVGNELLSGAIKHAHALAPKPVVAGIVRDNHFGYAGLEPVGHGVGIPEFDRRSHQWLTQNGFEVSRRSVRMVASSEGYRPPISREAVQLRRTSKMDRRATTSADPRTASAMAHFDVDRYQLSDKSGSLLTSLDLWCSDPEAEVMKSSHALVDLNEAHERGTLEPAESFLLASMLQSLAERHIFSVETVVDDDRTELQKQLQTLHFQPQDAGHLWRRD